MRAGGAIHFGRWMVRRLLVGDGGKDPTGPALAFDPAAWRAFVAETARRP
ncbi:DUF397 domain-containing protein [Plantactinospora alkalitolerans]|nr:DUF397 domain-containing protein [Plantactinospora alkalitolerans]